MTTEKTSANKITFRTVVLQSKKTATGIEIPAVLVEQLGAGKKPPVKVTINGYTYRSSIASMGGKFMVGLSALVRENSGVKGGDEITVEIVVDTEPREVKMPPALTAGLEKNPGAKAFFDSLSFSNKQRIVLSIEQAKTEETRQKRVEKALADQAANKKM